MPAKTQKASNLGFTLVELMVSMVILGILLVLLNGFFISGLIKWHRVQDKAEVVENLRIGLNRVTREIRQARYFPFESGSPSQQGKVTFTSLEGINVTYYCSVSTDAEHACQLIRKAGGAANPVARYVKEIIIDPPDYNEHTRMINITLAGEKGKSGVVRVSTRVSLRKAD
ncbi:PilW family protein [Desulfotruncus arcticus]|uniref:PilW family protein n=1 Tax=Desulfotruncus arcticus TaxID=341036 RepID=UPI000A5BDAE1|nr:prepilin-type N-terminal cleavage/methylation domain-containing protein [Desulfotruncus arcticus]